MPQFDIVKAMEFHCGQIVRRLRNEHLAAIVKLGVNTHRELRRAFDDSSYRKALLIDGQLAALGGVTGPAMASSGTIWLAITQEATAHPHHIAKIARREIAEILKIKIELSTFILPADEASLRFAKVMGFQTLRNSTIDISEGKMVPMVIRRERKTPYAPPAAESLSLH